MTLPAPLSPKQIQKMYNMEKHNGDKFRKEMRKRQGMKKQHDVALKLLAKAAYANAEKEANSACLFIGYQPKMPQKVKELKERK